MNIDKPWLIAKKLWLAQRSPSAIDICEARNLGPMSAKLLRDVEIKTLEDLMKVGWKSCYEKVVRKNSKSLNANLVLGIAAAEFCIDWRTMPENLRIEIKNFHEKLKMELKSNN